MRASLPASGRTHQHRICFTQARSPDSPDPYSRLSGLEPGEVWEPDTKEACPCVRATQQTKPQPLLALWRARCLSRLSGSDGAVHRQARMRVAGESHA